MWSVDSGLEQSVTHDQTVLWRNLNSFFDAFMYWPFLTHFFLIEKCLSPATLFKRRLWQWCFPVNFVKFLRTPFFAEHLLTIVSEISTFDAWLGFECTSGMFSEKNEKSCWSEIRKKYNSLKTQQQISDFLVFGASLWWKELWKISDCFSLSKLTYRAF